MNNYERKYSEDGALVAALYSPGYGSGWSTWCDDHHKEQLIFDKRLVEAALSGVTDIEPLVKEIFGNSYVCTGGWGDIQVAWLERGERFIIKELDGSESIRSLGKPEYYTA